MWYICFLLYLFCWSVEHLFFLLFDVLGFQSYSQFVSLYFCLLSVQYIFAVMPFTFPDVLPYLGISSVYIYIYGYLFEVLDHSILFINTRCGGVWSVYIALCSLLYQVGSCSGVIHFVCLRLECLLFETSLFGVSDCSEWAVQAVCS